MELRCSPPGRSRIQWRLSMNCSASKGRTIWHNLAQSGTIWQSQYIFKEPLTNLSCPEFSILCAATAEHSQMLLLTSVYTGKSGTHNKDGVERVSGSEDLDLYPGVRYQLHQWRAKILPEPWQGLLEQGTTGPGGRIADHR